MKKIQLNTEIDVGAMLAQMGTDKLEIFKKEITKILALRKTPNLQAQETGLLRRLNEECSLPPESWSRFRSLCSKKKSEALSTIEQKELAHLIKEEERLRLKRVLLLGELAKLKGQSLDEVSEELGIYPMKDAC